MSLTGFNMRRREAGRVSEEPESASKMLSSSVPPAPAASPVPAPTPEPARAAEAEPDRVISISGHWNQRRVEIQGETGIDLPRKKMEAAALLRAHGYRVTDE